MSMSNKQHKNMVTSLRNYLRGLANKRSNEIVTADDAHNFLTRKGIREQMIRTRLSLINSAFQSGDFEVVGYTPSERPAAKGRSISEWTVA